jgi:hypothetical protein
VANIWKANQEINETLQALKEKYHLPRLDDASVVVAFTDTKPFIKNRFNWGTVKKFTDFQKIWSAEDHTFCIILCADMWHDILNPEQQQAWLDLQLTRCEPVYVPETVEENGKKKVLKDDYGRVKYTDEIKLDEFGKPKWQIAPLDLVVFTKNVRRFGLWCEPLMEFGSILKESQK